MIENVFIIGTQAQYLNAVEAVEEFNVSFERSLLIAPRAMVWKKGVPPQPWGRTGWYSYGQDVSWLTRIVGRRTRAARAIRTMDHLRTLKSFIPDGLSGVRVFVGNVQDRRARHLIHLLEPSEIVLLDDGTATVEIARTLREGDSQGRIECFVEYILGLNTKYPRGGVLFTNYNVSVPKKWSVRRNKYHVLRSKMGTREACRESMIVGGPYVELDFMRLDTYLESLETINRFARYSVTYVPHRGETESTIKAVKMRLSCDVWRPPDALEVALVERGCAPAEIFGFYSSFLPNAASLFEGLSTITAVEVRFPKSSAQRQAEISKIYDYFKCNVVSNGFFVRNIKNQQDAAPGRSF